MATIVDELLIKFGFDTVDVKKGGQQTRDEAKKTSEEARKRAKEMEESAKSAGQFYSRLRGEILLLFAAFTGGKSVKQFAADIVESTAAIGRMTGLLSANTKEISTWEGAVKATGGSAGSASSSIGSLNQSMQQLSITGESSVIPYLRALNIGITNSNGLIKTATQLLPELHKALQGMDPARAAAIGHGLGLSDDMIYVLTRSDEEYKKLMDDQERWGVVTEAQAKQARDLQYSMKGVGQSFETLGRMLVTSLAPILIRINEWFTKLFVWFQSHPTELKATVAGLVAAFTALGAVMAGSAIASFAGILSTIGVAIGATVSGVMLLVGALAAAAAAVVLLYDDWQTWMTGGKSLFGDFYQYVLDKWNSIKGTVFDVIAELKHIFQEYVDVVKSELDFIGSLFFGSAEDIRASWAKMIGSLKKLIVTLFEDSVKIIENAGPAIMRAMMYVFGEAFGWVTKRANVIWEAIFGKKLFDDGPKNADQADNIGQGGGGGAGGKITPASREQYEKDMQFFMGKGWTREQAAGIVANIARESSGDPNATGDNGAAKGLAQWNKKVSPDRWANFRRLYGHDIDKSTREEQLEFINWELNNSHKNAGDRLRRETDERGSAGVVSKYYEIPADEKMEMSLRGSLAKQLVKPYEDPLNKALSAAPPSSGNVGAPTSAEFYNATNDNSRTSNNDVRVGTINVQTNATDASGIARDIKPALEKNTFANTANSSYN